MTISPHSAPSNAGPEAPLENLNAQVTCLVYSEPYLMVGTQGGYLLVFSIHSKHHGNRTRHMSIPSTVVQSLPSSPKLSLGHRSSTSHARKLDYNHVAAIHCCSKPIVRIHPLPMQGGMASTSPFLNSPTGHAMNILVMFGQQESLPEDDEQDAAVAHSSVHLYEIVSSPLTSPMTSPQTVAGRMSTCSTQSLPPGAPAHRKCYLQDLDAMPKLTISRVSKGSLSYLPLQDNSRW